MKKGDKLKLTCTVDDLRNISIGHYMAEMMLKNGVTYHSTVSPNTNQVINVTFEDTIFWVYKNMVRADDGQLEFNFMRRDNVNN